METIRNILKQRDRATDAEVDDLFAGFHADLAEGMDPEEALADWFGLEPDYIFDFEVNLWSR